MYVLQTTWQINGYIEHSQQTFRKYDDMILRLSHLEAVFIGDTSIRLLNVEIFHFSKDAKHDPDF